MAGNWMEERERMIRERDGRGRGDRPGSRTDEGRSWDHDPVFGERESGASYGRAGGGYGREASTGWQAPDYGGVSPAMQRGDYGQDASPNRQRQGGERFSGHGPGYGDDHGRRGAGYGEASARRDQAYSPTREQYHAEGYGQPGYGAPRGDMSHPASGGTGGYDYERGYGDGGRGESRDDGRADRMENAGRQAGEFLHRAGERMASWFGGGGEGHAYDQNGFDRDRGGARGARGKGPQGYKRSDERISDDAHERLTDDPWLDASDISISVSGGEVTLSGTVENRESKHRAERLIEDMNGVNHVQNNLRLAKSNPFTSHGRGYGDSVLGAQLRDAEGDDPVANGTGGAGGGQSTAGRKA